MLRRGEERTRRKGVERLLKLLRGLGKLECLAVLHTNAEDEALHLADYLRPEIPVPPFCVNVTPVIGAHVGPNGLGFAAVVK